MEEHAADSLQLLHSIQTSSGLRERERDGGTRPLRFSFALKHHPIGHIIHFIKPVFDFPPRFKIGRGFKESYGRLIDAV